MLFSESEKVELKATYISDLNKEIIAFANTQGGRIYIGVNDDGSVCGVDDCDGTIQQITNSCRDTVKPDITMLIHYQILSEQGKDVIQIDIQKGTSRPYYISGKGLRPSGVYVRQGTSSAPASDAAIRTMIRESDGEGYENLRSLNQDLTFNELHMWFSKNSLPLEPVHMKTLGLINEEGLYTNLALLLSEQCPHLIKAAVFRGTDRVEFQDRQEFSGSLLRQMEDAYRYLSLNNRRNTEFNGLERIDRLSYPESAVREALLNSIIHREYSFSASTLISVYSDRMEFVSIGGLPGGITLDDVLMGLSVCRNRRLAEVFYRLRLIEAYGTGLAKIRDAYSESAPALFETTQNSFKVTLPDRNHIRSKKAVTKKTNSDDSSKIIDLLKQNRQLSRTQIQNALAVSPSKAIRLLAKLKEMGVIASIGSARNTAYRLTVEAFRED